jgi:hypothetical protein
MVLALLLVSGYGAWKISTLSSEQAELASSNPTAEVKPSGNLLADTQGFLQFVSDPSRFTYQNCAESLSAITASFDQADPRTYDLAQTQNNFLPVIETLWQLRLKLHDRLTEFSQHDEIASKVSDPCVAAIRDATRFARFTEDYLGEAFLGIPPYDAGKDPKSINTLQGEAPHLLKAPGVDQVTLRSGDLILSRGDASTSAAIARIGVVPSQFSHLAVVYVEDEPLGKEFTIDEALKNPHVQMLEAHIEIGSTIRPFKDYVADGNVRNFLFRYPDAPTAARAAKSAHDYLVSRRQLAQKHNGGALDDPNNNVPYDFHMNLKDPSEIFCSEMGYVAYHSVGVELPEFPTTLEARNDVVTTLGITQLVNFAPGDLELDTRFQPIAEWRDYRKVHDVRYKDAALSAMFRWMKDRNYELHANTVMDMKALFAWLSRHADLSFAKTQLPKNMPVATLKMVFTLDKVCTSLEKEIGREETAYHRATGRLFTALQMQDLLEKFRARDAVDYTNAHSSAFHFEFHSPEELNQRRSNGTSLIVK